MVAGELHASLVFIFLNELEITELTTPHQYSSLWPSIPFAAWITIQRRTVEDWELPITIEFTTIKCQMVRVSWNNSKKLVSLVVSKLLYDSRNFLFLMQSALFNEFTLWFPRLRYVHHYTVNCFIYRCLVQVVNYPMELISSKIRLCIGVSTLRVISEQIWSWVCHNEQDMSNSERLPNSHCFGYGEVREDRSESNICFFRRSVVAIGVVCPGIMIIKSVDYRNIFHKGSHGFRFEYFMVCLLEIWICGQSWPCVVHVTYICKEQLLDTCFLVLLSKLFNSFENMVLRHRSWTRWNLDGKLLGEEFVCFKTTLIFRTWFAPVLKLIGRVRF